MMKAFLPLILLAASPALADDTKDFPEHGTRLDIVATGQVQRAPDLATIGAGVVTQATEAGTAMASNAQRMTATVAALKRAGVADRDIQTAQVSLQPQYRYGENQPPILTGYQVSNRVTVRLRELRNAGKILDALVAAGANQIDGPTFGIDKPEAALDEARTQAIATARGRAELYAKAAGLRVVRIARISESGQAESPIRPQAMMAMRNKAADTTVEAGEQELSVTVSVSFELGQ